MTKLHDPILQDVAPLLRQPNEFCYTDGPPPFYGNVVFGTAEDYVRRTYF